MVVAILYTNYIHISKHTGTDAILNFPKKGIEISKIQG